MKNFALILMLLVALKSHACKCAGPKTLHEYFESAEMVIKGKVLSNEKVDGSHHHKVQIERTYKGNLSSKLILIKSDASTSCQFGMNLGQTYFVFMTKGIDNAYWTGECSGTQIFTVEKENQLYFEPEKSNEGLCEKIDIYDTLDLKVLKSDPFHLMKVSLEDACIKFNVSYGSGCGTAKFRLITDNRITESMRPIMDVYLTLNDDDDCEAIKSLWVNFDLSEFLPFATSHGLQVRILNNDSIVLLKTD